ncbi:ABC transporter substrate-binding protein [Paenibacillus oenotherae]|uniref:ABC transporter substrate-binding protein n=1 Tax=Paenibacillus oenotherae TaxID=1435645 RepID=A0ABS7D2E8_9BACL|nr:ABC transporter substrate-binding protein [Paenibacillus oenotherae]MBW7474104.1 ABC transporter substrate-binding protein [Paenibacillus oenotherae]
MNGFRKMMTALCILALLGALLTACGSNSGESSSDGGSNNKGTAQGSTTVPPAQASDEAEETADGTRSYTDYKGHVIELSTAPQRIIYAGETIGDLIVLDAPIIGTPHNWVQGSVYVDRLKDVADVGFPINLEKALELQPDLIITGSTEEKDYEQLSKIAPTLMFDTFAPLEDRMTLLGDLLGKKEQAAEWIAKYNASTGEMWKELYEKGLTPGETASVFTYYPGDRLFVMAATGLSQVLYHPDGLKPTPAIQKILDDKKGFEQISMETLAEYAGDRIFILKAVDKEAQQSTDALFQSNIWKNLPAVKNNRVYTIDILKSNSDAATREWLLQELARMLQQ